MMRPCRFAGPFVLTFLVVASAVQATPRPPRAPSPPSPPSPADTVTVALRERAAGGSVESAVASLRDLAASDPARADEAAAALLLLDRNDAALEVLLAAGHRAGAFELLAGELRAREALALPGNASEPAARAVREAVALGLQSQAMALALDAVAGAPVGRSRELLAALWPAALPEAETAWTWLARRGGATSADDALLRVGEILDPAKPSRDADILLRDGAAMIAAASSCEQARLGAGLVGLATLRQQPDAALAAARAWVAAAGTPPAWAALGDQLADRASWAEAATAYGRAADLQPEEGGARWLQAAMLTRAGDAKGAAVARELARTAATSACAQLRLASGMSLAGDREAARGVHEALLRDEPPGSAVSAAAASRLARVHADAAAAALLRRSFAEARARAASGELSLARVLPIVRRAQAAELGAMVAQGDAEAALALAAHAIEPFLTNLDAAASLVNALRASGREGDASALQAAVSERIARAADENPDSIRLLNSRAWFGARTRSGLDEALVAAERAALLAPSSAGILDTLAEVRFQAGDREGALQAARRALGLEPDREYLQRQVERIAAGSPATDPPIHLP